MQVIENPETEKSGSGFFFVGDSKADERRELRVLVSYCLA